MLSDISSTSTLLAIENQANVDDVNTIADTMSIAMAEIKVRFFNVFFIFSLPP
jgi:hypothetical protein